MEGITYADIDLDACVPPKQFHDITGAYNRADIFRLRVNRNPQSLLEAVEDMDEKPSNGITSPAERLPDAAE